MSWYITIGDESPIYGGGHVGSIGVRHYGEIHTAAYWEMTDPLDEAGTFTFEMPAGDPVAAQLVEKRPVMCLAQINGVMERIGAGIIDLIELVLDANGNPTGNLRVSGSNMLRILTYNHVGTLHLTNTTGLSDIMDFAFPVGLLGYWTLIGSGSVTIPDYTFANESVLEALIKQTTLSGEHFRAGDWVTPVDHGGLYYTGGWLNLKWIQSVATPSGVRAFYGIQPLAGDEISGQCIITDIRRTKDSHKALVGRIYATGSGVAGARITLNGATVPAGYLALGYTIGNDAKGYYLEHTTTMAEYGIEDVVAYQDVDHPQSLFRAAVVDMARRLIIPAEYQLKVAGLPDIIRPGQTLRVVAHQFVNGYHAIDIDEDLNILDVTNRVDDSGAYTIGMTCSNIDKKLETGTKKVVRQIQELKQFTGHDQGL
jgi:hypothetical protein